VRVKGTHLEPPQVRVKGTHQTKHRFIGGRVEIAVFASQLAQLAAHLRLTEGRTMLSATRK